MVNDILTPMNHREIDYYAGKLSGCDIPDAFSCKELLDWLEEMGQKLFDEDLVMDYGTDCLRLYLLFENTPQENDAPYYESWQEGALEGVYKFLGKYRRAVLAVAEWNSLGGYSDTFTKEGLSKMNAAFDLAKRNIERCISKGNTMPNRHNIVAALMELLKVFQKELKVGEILSALHTHAIETAVPRSEAFDRDICQNADCEGYVSKSCLRNEDVDQICRSFIIMMAPFAPNLSKILWEKVKMLLH